MLFSCVKISCFRVKAHLLIIGFYLKKCVIVCCYCSVFKKYISLIFSSESNPFSLESQKSKMPQNRVSDSCKP